MIKEKTFQIEDKEEVRRIEVKGYINKNQKSIMDWINLSEEEELLLNKIRVEAKYEGYKFRQKNKLTQ